MSDSDLIVWVRDGGTATADRIGGKGYGLQQLATFGLPIPPAFCLTVDAQRVYARDCGHHERVAELASLLPDAEARVRLEATAFQAEWPRQLAGDLSAALQRFAQITPASMLAVRSSAIDEDQAGTSFAGQHETVLGVCPAGVENAVRVCWASLWSQRATAYRMSHGIDFPINEMAVVVQELIDADTSAIAFSLDPVSGRRDRIMITVTHGLCEPIVSGTVNPDTAVLDKDSLELLSYDEGDKAVRVVPRNGGGVVRLSARSNERAADDDSLRELALMVIAAEQHLGVPVDVEAARDQSGWRLVQLRPAFLGTADPPPEPGAPSVASEQRVTAGLAQP
jgi:phosphoenolpyruvate synthase/pyruvate phosphate dikinase